MPHNEWEKEFDYIFPTNDDGAVGHRHDGDCEWQCAKHKKIKQFISDQITKTKEETIREVIEKMKFNIITFDRIGGISNMRYVKFSYVKSMLKKLRQDYNIKD